MAALQNLVVALAVVAVGSFAEASLPTSSDVANQFVVTYSTTAQGYGQDGFYTMPRTINEARKSQFARAVDRRAIDGTTVWCRSDDYRVCVLFDRQGSVAGLQVSGSVAELAASGAPLDLDSNAQWFRQTLYGTEVYSSISYFVDQDTLDNGGRRLHSWLHPSTPTAPNGIRVLETAADGKLSSVSIPSDESFATSLDFTKQGCLPGMGQHYFHNLTTTTECDTLKPYFLLYGASTETLLGYGVLQWGALSAASRTWFENPNALAIEYIATSRPQCLLEWVEAYTLTSLHVYFVKEPWTVTC